MLSKIKYFKYCMLPRSAGGVGRAVQGVGESPNLRSNGVARATQWQG